MATELAGLQVAVIFADTTVAVQAAKQATNEIPIVMGSPGGAALPNVANSLAWQTDLSAPTDTKRLFGALANRPPDRPPDPENGRPGTVGTATGAGRKAGVLNGTSKNYLSLSQLVQSQSPVLVHKRARIVGAITKSDRQHDAFDVQGLRLSSFRTRTGAIRAFPFGGAS